jgi:hypothetical protein
LRQKKREQRAGRACTFDTLIESGDDGTLETEKSREIDLTRRGSGRSSNDGKGSNPLPARSDGLDNVNGGPDARLYIEIGII